MLGQMLDSVKRHSVALLACAVSPPWLLPVVRHLHTGDTWAGPGDNLILVDLGDALRTPPSRPHVLPRRFCFTRLSIRRPHTRRRRRSPPVITGPRADRPGSAGARPRLPQSVCSYALRLPHDTPHARRASRSGDSAVHSWPRVSRGISIWSLDGCAADACWHGERRSGSPGAAALWVCAGRRSHIDYYLFVLARHSAAAWWRGLTIGAQPRGPRPPQAATVTCPA
jgi:hypothetical protein